MRPIPTGTDAPGVERSYEGNFRKGRKHGQGTFTWADGGRYEGQFYEGKKQGLGAYVWANGSKYEGQWHEDEMHGDGTFTAASGWCFKGNLQHDRPTEGELKEGDGRHYLVSYRRDCAVIQDRPTPDSKTDLGAAWTGSPGSPVLMTTMATATKAGSPGSPVLMTSGKTSACTRAQGDVLREAANPGSARATDRDSEGDGQGGAARPMRRSRMLSEDARLALQLQDEELKAAREMKRAESSSARDAAGGPAAATQPKKAAEKPTGTRFFSPKIFSPKIFSPKSSVTSAPQSSFSSGLNCGHKANKATEAVLVPGLDPFPHKTSRSSDEPTLLPKKISSSKTESDEEAQPTFAKKPSPKTLSVPQLNQSTAKDGMQPVQPTPSKTAPPGFVSFSQTSSSAPVTADSKRKRDAVYDSLLLPRRAKATITVVGGVAGAPTFHTCHCCRRARPVYDADEIHKLAEVLYRWEWRTSDGTYKAFDRQQCITLETSYRQGSEGSVVWGRRFLVGDNEELKCSVDFGDMTAAIAGTEWVTAVRRWDRDVQTGEGWDHQDDNLLIVDVQPEWRDYTIVESALYDRPREDGREPSIRRQSHEVVRVRRIQNHGQYGQFKVQQRELEQRRGKKEVELTTRYAWHGTGKTRPDKIASEKGFFMQYSSNMGFYGQGAYFAEQASYSHHEKYVYRSSDEAGEHQCDTGTYHHLLLVNVLRGKPLKTAEVWRGEGFGSVQSKLGQEHDSVEGGPHRPMFAGRGPDDSLMYVVYQSSQCLPEFIVTYRERAV